MSSASRDRTRARGQPLQIVAQFRGGWVTQRAILFEELAEARTVATLNHPNIRILHDLGPNYLVMELVPGETLAERLRSGPIPAKESLRLGIQIAEALEAAHAKGITHRDIKPANIKVTADGRVKVLDFGLAKVDSVYPSAAGDTVTAMTQAGLAMERRRWRQQAHPGVR